MGELCFGGAGANLCLDYDELDGLLEETSIGELRLAPSAKIGEGAAIGLAFAEVNRAGVLWLWGVLDFVLRLGLGWWSRFFGWLGLVFFGVSHG